MGHLLHGALILVSCIHICRLCCCCITSVVSDSVRHSPLSNSVQLSPIPGILQARTLEWVAISFSNAWKWKVKVKSLSHVQLLATPWTAAYQAPLSMGFSRQEYWSGCHCLLRLSSRRYERGGPSPAMPWTTVCLTYIIGMLNKYFEINLIPALPVIELWQGRKFQFFFWQLLGTLGTQSS